jgi:hypothetical protein
MEACGWVKGRVGVEAEGLGVGGGVGGRMGSGARMDL